MCHAPLRVRGHRDVETSRGRRRVPLYHPCPSLDDPSKHPARRGETRGVDAVTLAAAPFPRGSRIRFVGGGPLAARLQVGLEVVVRETLGSRSLVEHGDRTYAIWPGHASHWQVVEIERPL